MPNLVQADFEHAHGQGRGLHGRRPVRLRLLRRRRVLRERLRRAVPGLRRHTRELHRGAERPAARHARSCAGAGSACGGACGTHPDACDYPGGATQCRLPSCAASVKTVSAGCDGKGACPAAQTESCGAFQCAWRQLRHRLRQRRAVRRTGGVHRWQVQGPARQRHAVRLERRLQIGLLRRRQLLQHGLHRAVPACNVTPGQCTQVSGAPGRPRRPAAAPAPPAAAAAAQRRPAATTDRAVPAGGLRRGRRHAGRLVRRSRGVPGRSGDRLRPVRLRRHHVQVELRQRRASAPRACSATRAPASRPGRTGAAAARPATAPPDCASTVCAATPPATASAKRAT